jgi:hypothetical protein
MTVLGCDCAPREEHDFFERSDGERRTDATVHGFRSSFRDWTGNETHHPREIAEQALAHVIGDKAEQASTIGRVGEAPEANGRLGGLLRAVRRRRQGHSAAKESLAAGEKHGDRPASRLW